MNWLNLHISILNSPEFLGADPVQRATWLCLLAYCIGQENGGLITDCSGWRDRQWQQVVRVTLREVRDASDLWRWEGSNLIVVFYPLEKEQEVQARRGTAIINGGKGGRPRKSPPETDVETDVETHGTTDEKPTLVISGKAEGERKEKGKRNPLPPEGNGGGEVSNKEKSERKSASLKPVSQEAKRLSAIFHRKPDTAWSAQEVRAFKSLGSISEADLAVIEKYYSSNWPPLHGGNVLRHDLKTLLNNFPGELDRANTWASRKPASGPGLRVVRGAM